MAGAGLTGAGLEIGGIDAEGGTVTGFGGETGAGGAMGPADGGLGAAGGTSEGGFGAAGGALGGEGGLGTESPTGAAGGAGATGGAEGGAFCTGFGGRLIIAVSRGFELSGWPSRRGGRTIRTVSFLGSSIIMRSGVGQRPDDRLAKTSQNPPRVSTAACRTSNKNGLLIGHSAANGDAFPDRLLKFRLRRNNGGILYPATARSAVFSSLSKRPLRFFENPAKKSRFPLKVRQAARG